MNKHTLQIEQLENFESTTVLASSTKDKKMLLISSALSDGQLVSKFVIKHHDKPVAVTGSLSLAITHYNNI